MHKGGAPAARRVPNPRWEDGRVAGTSSAAEMATAAGARARARGLEVEARAVRGRWKVAAGAGNCSRARETRGARGVKAEPRSGGQKHREADSLHWSGKHDFR